MLHSYPFYPADWRSSKAVLMMPLEARALYRELLDWTWEDGYLPTDPEVLRKMARAEKDEWERAWPSVRPLFEERDGKFWHPKVDARRPELVEYHEARRRGGKSRAAKVQHPAETHSSTMLKAVSAPCSNPVQHTAESMVQHMPPSSTSTSSSTSCKYTDLSEPSRQIWEAHPKHRRGSLILVQQGITAKYGSDVDPERSVAGLVARHAAWRKHWAEQADKFAPNLPRWILEHGDDEPPDPSPEQLRREAAAQPSERIVGEWMTPEQTQEFLCKMDPTLFDNGPKQK